MDFNINYKNVFAEAGYSDKEIEQKVSDCFNEIFYGKDKFFHMTEDGKMAYLEDTGNHDVRTEGMSYGMMMCVQTGHKEEFDLLWRFARTYMYMDYGRDAGYFAWSVACDGKKNAESPAPDGEEFFAMALLFASHRWGDGEGIFCYSEEAKKLLCTCIHKEETGNGRNMWDKDNYLVRFVPECDFTDPSYHLPHFYRLFALWGNKEDSGFWEKAAQASRDYLQKACNSITGLNPEYSYFDGTPYEKQEIFGRHDWFYSDAYRTIANIALDNIWPGMEDGSYKLWSSSIAAKVQHFFDSKNEEGFNIVYTTDGVKTEEKVLHPAGLLATIAQASLISSDASALRWVRIFWNTPMRTGDRRYYDNCLYMFAVLALSGQYRIW